MPLIRRAAEHLDGVTLLAAYHTAYNVVGVAVLMPVIDWLHPFRRVAAARDALAADARPRSGGARKSGGGGGGGAAHHRARHRADWPGIEAAVTGEGEAAKDLSLAEPAKALREAQDFIAEVSGTPDSASEDLRLASTLHALDHMSRLVDAAGEEPEFPMAREDEDERRAAALCVEAMRSAVAAVDDIAREKAFGAAAAPLEHLETPAGRAALTNSRTAPDNSNSSSTPIAARPCARSATGEINVEQAMGRIETVRRLEKLARHAWRGVAALCGLATSRSRRRLS